MYCLFFFPFSIWKDLELQGHCVVFLLRRVIILFQIAVSPALSMNLYDSHQDSLFVLLEVYMLSLDYTWSVTLVLSEVWCTFSGFAHLEYFSIWNVRHYCYSSIYISSLSILLIFLNNYIFMKDKKMPRWKVEPKSMNF